MIKRLHNISAMNFCQAGLLDTLLLHGYLPKDAEEIGMIDDSQRYMMGDIMCNLAQLDKRHLYAVFNVVQDVLIAQTNYLRADPIAFEPETIRAQAVENAIIPDKSQLLTH